jgi:hypothetical protein
MQPPSFTQILKTEVARMRTAHPEREGDLARANALILQGMVVPSADDPETGQVLSSDGQKVYHVNGTCSCTAGEHGRDCRHQHAWRLYQYIVRKVDAQDAPSPAGATPDTPPAPDVLQPLGEAPASVNCHLTIAGRQVQLTLRGQSEDDVLARLEKVLQRYAAAPSDVPQCPIHHAPMKINHGKDGRTWTSHKTPDGWCKGR